MPILMQDGNFFIGHDEHSMLRSMVTHAAGFEVTLFGMLSLRPLEDGAYAVSFEADGESWEHVFDEVDPAVCCFIERRNTMGLGLDHERAEWV